MIRGWSVSNTYTLGTAVKITAEFKTEAGDLFDPDAVIAKVQKPSDAAGTVTSYTYGIDAEVERTSTGLYFMWIATDEIGDWVYGWLSDDDHDVANDGTFSIETNFR